MKNARKYTEYTETITLHRKLSLKQGGFSVQYGRVHWGHPILVDKATTKDSGHSIRNIEMIAR